MAFEVECWFGPEPDPQITQMIIDPQEWGAKEKELRV
jgi:hypothetical protein